MAKTLFDFDYSIPLSGQESFPLNEAIQGRTVEEIILKDLAASEQYLIVTGFTSISNLIEILGYKKYPRLKKSENRYRLRP